jgi:hypothetical protein
MRSPAPLALLLFAFIGCSRGSAPATVPAPGRELENAPTVRRVLLARGYAATVTVERRDSIVIALPDGSSQVQRAFRHFRFAVAIDANGAVRVRLDSLAAVPASRAPRDDLAGTSWTGQLTRQGLTEVAPPSADPQVAFLTGQVVELFPAVPRGGASEGERWADTTADQRQVEIFAASDRRRSAWTVGGATRSRGIEVLPVSVTEWYEQLGKGVQAGREMQMSAQGVRSATYYVSALGRIDGMVQTDSAQRLITIPSTQQAVPTTQVVRTVVRWQ